MFNELYSAPTLLVPSKKPFSGYKLNTAHLTDCYHVYPFIQREQFNDFGVNRKDLSKSGSVSWAGSPSGPGYKFGGSTSDYLTTGSLGAQAPTTWTFEVLFQVSSTSSQYICGYQEAPGNSTADRRLYLSSTGVLECQIFDGDNQYATAGVSIVAGGVYHVIVSCDGTNFHLAVNGISSGITTVLNGGYTGYATPEFIIGRGILPSGAGGGDRGLDATVLLCNVYRVYIPEFVAARRTVAPLHRIYSPINTFSFPKEALAPSSFKPFWAINRSHMIGNR